MAENRQSGSDRTQHSHMSEDKHPLGRQDQIREEQVERQRQNQQREQGGQDGRSDRSGQQDQQRQGSFDRQQNQQARQQGDSSWDEATQQGSDREADTGRR